MELYRALYIFEYENILYFTTEKINISISFNMSGDKELDRMNTMTICSIRITNEVKD